VAPVRLSSGAGAWVSVMTLTGEADAPYVNKRAQIVTVVPHLDLGLRLKLANPLVLFVGLSGGISAPSVSIQFAGREVATWGRPLLLGSLSLEAALD
jgi:hypothetical protein